MGSQNGTSAEEIRYQALLERGISRENAARIVNAEAEDNGKIVGEPESYEDWTDDELYQRAGELGVEDRFGMGRDELIAAIRSH